MHTWPTVEIKPLNDELVSLTGQQLIRLFREIARSASGTMNILYSPLERS